MYACPQCESEINQASEICPYCGSDLTGPRTDATGTPARKSTLAKRAVLWAFVLVMLWIVAWFAVPWRISGSKSAAEQRARDAITSLQSALGRYQSTERTFPQTLEPLGDAARRAAQSAQVVHYNLQYTPGPLDPEGRITTYTLLARAGNFGYLNFYTDETGVLHGATEDRPATSQDPRLTP
jgi:hypothetical protein